MSWPFRTNVGRVSYGGFIAAVMLIGSTTVGSATGFYIQHQGAPGIGRAQAGGSAIAQDATTVFFNPAGMVELPKAEFSAGVSLIHPRVEIRNRGTDAVTPGTLGQPAPVVGASSGTPGSVTPIVNIFAAYPLIDDDLWVGFGVTSPFGNALEYDRDWFGRYNSIESRLITVNLGPVVAYRVTDFLSIGGGIDIQYADAKLTNAVPNTLAPGGPTVATDGFSDLDGDDWSVGFNIGVLLLPTEDLRVGLHYRSGMDHDLEGRAVVSDLTGPLAAANGRFDSSTSLDLPDILSVGLAYEATSELTLLGEFQWFGWNSFNELRVNFDDGMPDAVRRQDFRNTFSVAGGAEYRLSEDWTLRGGMQYDRTPTVDGSRNTSLPDGDRLWLAAGATYNLAEGWFVDAALSHAFIEHESINVTDSFFEQSPAAGEVTTRGKTSNSITTFAVMVRYRF